jgi:T-complex protein 1 subunit theta
MAQSLITTGLHPADILVGYEKAYLKSMELMDKLPTVKCENLKSVEEVSKFLTPVIGTKLLQGQEDVLAPLIADACIKVTPSVASSFNADNVRICKMLGGSLPDSMVIQGLVVVRLTEGCITKVDVNNFF